MNTTLCITKENEPCVKMSNCECPQTDEPWVIITCFAILALLMGFWIRALSNHGKKKKKKKTRILPI
jgi:hypothetical protein